MLTLRAPLGSGLATRRHDVPLQCRMRVWYPPVAVKKEPTAQASVPDVAATEFKPLGWVVPPGLGLGTLHQLMPFHCSVRGWAGAFPVGPPPPAFGIEVAGTPENPAL